MLLEESFPVTSGPERPTVLGCRWLSSFTTLSDDIYLSTGPPDPGHTVNCTLVKVAVVGG